MAPSRYIKSLGHKGYHLTEKQTHTLKMLNVIVMICATVINNTVRPIIICKQLDKMTVNTCSFPAIAV